MDILEEARLLVTMVALLDLIHDLFVPWGGITWEELKGSYG